MKMYLINQEFKYRNNPVIKRKVVIQCRSIKENRNKYEVERIYFKETRGGIEPYLVDFEESQGFKFVTIHSAMEKAYQEVGRMMCKLPGSILIEQYNSSLNCRSISVKDKSEKTTRN